MDMTVTDPPAKTVDRPEGGASVPLVSGKRLQMADIARMAGVSTTTVSRALSGSSLVNKATRKRVTELARSLNYTVNAGAKELRLGHSTTVGVVVPYGAHMRQALSDPFFLGMLGSIADALTERGYDMLLSRIDEENLRLASTPYDSGRAMGIIVIGQGHHHDHLNQLAARGVPLVVWGAQLPNQLYCTVGCDNIEGGRLATGHLLSRGCRRIAFFGDTDQPELVQRLEGYRQALADAGIAFDPALVRRTPAVASGGHDAVLELKAEEVPFDAIFACSDLLAMAAISSLRDLGLRVPLDVAVVGYDDVSLASQFHPPLTTVRQPVEAGGRALVASLLCFLGQVAPRSQLLPIELVVRGSA
jgi:DNA-binding LacI/PurR family transcriptional regulator